MSNPVIDEAEQILEKAKQDRLERDRQLKELQEIDNGKSAKAKKIIPIKSRKIDKTDDEPADNPRDIPEPDLPANGKDEFVPQTARGKILLQVWHVDIQAKTRPYRVAKKWFKYGKKYVTLRIAGLERKYQIDYHDVGAFKQSGKHYVYDVDFTNAIGALSFYPYPKEVDSRQAEIMLQDGAVDSYIKKGGIPLYYMLIAMVGIIVVAGALAFILPDYLGTRDLAEKMIAENNNLRNSNQQLVRQVGELQQQLGESSN